MKSFNALGLFTAVFLLSGCTDHIKETPKASEQQQKDVSEKVIGMLEREYHQPFKIVDYTYEYKGHSNGAYDCAFIYCQSHMYGEYNFNIQSVDNPFITIRLHLSDGSGIPNMLKNFKEKNLKGEYCSAFGNLFDKNYINKEWVYPKEQPIEKSKFYKAADFCKQKPSKYDISKKEVDKLTNFALYFGGGRTNWTIELENTPKSIDTFLDKMFQVIKKWDTESSTIGVKLFSLDNFKDTVTIHPEGTFMISNTIIKDIKSPSDLRKCLYLRKS